MILGTYMFLLQIVAQHVDFPCTRRLPVLEATAAGITSLTGKKVLAVQMDVRDPEAVSKALDECEKEFGLPNAVINNAAGNFVSVSPFLLI